MGSQILEQSRQQSFPWEGKEGQDRRNRKGGRETGKISGSGHEREGSASPRGTIERGPQMKAVLGMENKPNLFPSEKKDRASRQIPAVAPRRDSSFCHTERYLGIDHLPIDFFF